MKAVRLAVTVYFFLWMPSPVLAQGALNQLEEEAGNGLLCDVPAIKEVVPVASTRESLNQAGLEDLLPENPFVLEAKQVTEILQRLELTPDELLQKLIPVAKKMALPPISNYYVGAAGLGKSGNIYLGVNLEFQGFPLNQTVHGEQFLIANARNHGETELVAIALSAAPCGHCRQFLNELGTENELRIIIPNHAPFLLSSLLPSSFGPTDLGVSGSLLTPRDNGMRSGKSFSLVAEAIQAANTSYAPYSKSSSGVAIRTTDGKVYMGSYMENAAFNPSLSPLQAALVALVADRGRYSDISEVVLVEGKDAMASQTQITKQLLKSIAPNARFRSVKTGQ